MRALALKEHGEREMKATIRVSEAVLQVSARLEALLGRDKSVVVVTGYDDFDGASEVAAQIAVALARLSEAPVALVDANRDFPQIHEWMDLPNSPGFGDVLSGKIDEFAVLQNTPGGVTVISAGDAGSVLAAPGAGRFFDKLKARHRYVIIAAAPVLEASDTVTLCSLSDGAVLALRSGLRHVPEIKDVQKELARLNTQLFGAVIRGGKSE